MRVFAVLATVILLAGCSFTDEPHVDPPAELPARVQEVVRTDNAFGLQLFNELVQGEEGNVFMSPTSVSFALGMTANGANGQTYDEMVSVLRKGSLNPEEVNSSYRDLASFLETLDPVVRLRIANSIWYRNGYPVRSEFLDTNREYFAAEVAEADFNDPATVDRINGWVDEKTEGLIDKVIEQIDGSVVMYLINAIYFKGTWLYEFDPNETREASFANADGTTAQVPMMAQQADLPAFRHANYTAVDLPYGDSLYSMTVVLPEPGFTTDDVLAELQADDVAAWTTELSPTDVILSMPRFKVEYKESLVPMLKSMGMEAAFAPGSADFTRLVEGGGPWIDDVIHQAVLDVNEEGTEAAAVTTVIIVESAGSGPLRVTLDRPFLLFIRERISGSVLFMGRIAQL
ncbi:MAG: hypothetical protein JJ896_11215 [Rhodothermales bacterium]|nr:hypothetical protein [Rhodothermales bacterium]MBO6780211.1 hypothetical protein [Rhodothermales bacterium]